ncbi:hypothetical protein OAA60_05940 [Porticoccaceae bacterium]|nr:hypothetical protein [Porticoccaceae bacterium]|tara:strand:- start:204 stop:494 length:291 start_codon:yes stop_codon:yes gene_type:complete
MSKVKIKVDPNYIFSYVVGNSLFEPIEKCIDSTRYEVYDAFIYDLKTKSYLDQGVEYQNFYWEVVKLKKLAKKMSSREIQSLCEEIAEIAPEYVEI